MRAWRPDERASGPHVVADDDISALNALFSSAFTDRYRRDGLAGVRVPPLNEPAWHFARRCAGDGALVWRDDAGDPVAFNFVHCSGTEGWMGPLAVRPDRQGQGLGRAIVTAGVDRLIGLGARTIGLETMPRTVENIGFYARLGFVPGHLTVTMTRDVAGRASRGSALRLGALDTAARAAWRAAVHRAWRRVVPGCDYGAEMAETAALALGDVTVVPRGQRAAAAAIWHTVALTPRAADEFRVLKLLAVDGPAFQALLDAIETEAVTQRRRVVAIRCQTEQEAAFAALVDRGYQVRWTDLRMTLAGYPDVVPPAGAVAFSNWEI